MIASQLNLDERLAELLQTRITEYADQAAAHETASPVARVGAFLRSLVGGASATRTARAASH